MMDQAKVRQISEKANFCKNKIELTLTYKLISNNLKMNRIKAF